LARIVSALYGAGKGGARRVAGGPGDTVFALYGPGGGRRGPVVRIARRVAGVVLVVALILAPMYASAVDSGDTDGPATKITSGESGTQNKGSEGFFDHNGNGANGWSSWVNKASALEVDPKYAFRPYKEASADEYGPATTTGHFGATNQSGFGSAIEDNEKLVGATRGTTPDGSWGFKARGDDRAEAGKFGVTVDNARVHVPGRMEPALIDIRITCADYTVDGDIHGDYTPYIAIQKNDIAPSFVLLGVKEATFRYEYFVAGTETPYAFKSNLTYSDIDDEQYMAVSSADTEGVFLDKDTRLNYGYSGGKHIVFANFGEVSGDSHRTAFGAAFQTDGDGIAITFGNNQSSVAGDASEDAKKRAFNYAWFGGGVYNMWKPAIPAPFKTVSDGDESAVDHDTLLDGNEAFTYGVYQQIPSGMTDDDFFSSFIMKDQVDSCLDVRWVKVYSERHGSKNLRGAWDSADGVTNDEWFGITVSGDGLVTATAKSAALGDEAFYGGSSRADGAVSMQIRVAWDPGVTDGQKTAHGHRITSPANGWRVANRGAVTIDDTPKYTNEVTTDYFPPEKKVSDSDESLTGGNTLVNANEPFRYDVSQYVPAKSADDKKYSAMKFTDAIEPCLQITDVKVARDGGEDVTSLFTGGASGNDVVVTAKAESLAQASFYGHTYTLRVTAKLRTDVSETVLRQHGHYIEADRMLVYENRAAVGINDRNAVYTDIVTTRAPVPDLEIEKTVSRYENQVGDSYRYTVRVRHTAASQGDAANVRIWDFDLPEALTLSGITLSGLSTDHKELALTRGGFELTADVLKRSETAVIAFDAAAGKGLNGQIVTNTAWVYSFSDTGGDFTHPKKDDAEAYINSPKLKVVKSAQIDGDEIKKGDEIHYQVVITNINPGTFMRDCVFRDEITQAGIELIPSSITVKNSQNRLITNRCDIIVSGAAFSIEPLSPLNLAYADLVVPPKELGRNESFPPVRTNYAGLPLENRITVSYSVNVADPDLIEGDIVNTFVSPARPDTNGDPVKDDPDIPSGGDSATHAAIVADENPAPLTSPPSVETPELPDPSPQQQYTPAPELTPTPTPAPNVVVNLSPAIVTVAAADVDEEENENVEEDEESAPEKWRPAGGSPKTGDDFDPLIAAVILGCTGGLTLAMLIRRRRI
jgi:fimbrial isopeptide formation D2 family protein